MEEVHRHGASRGFFFSVSLLFLFSACDSRQSITGSSALEIQTSSLADGTIGNAYSDVLKASGGDGSYTWTLASGALPQGLFLPAEGIISGIPRTEGISRFTVRVQNRDGLTASANLSITISAGLIVTTASLASGVVGTAYSEILEAAGGDGETPWSLTAGALPDGLVMTADGLISGTPTVGGTSMFSVDVMSDDGQTASATLWITIETPVLVAFVGDQGWEPEDRANSSRAVLALIRDEGADLVLHQGDFDYSQDPARWVQQINDVLGPDFPYLASIGNHDTSMWLGPNGYRARLEARARSQGISWTGVLGEASSIVFGGIRILLGSPGLDSLFDPEYFARELALSTEAWRICSWHLNQRDMQVGGKVDEAGWPVYEACRTGGAVIATAHEHSYSRTHLLSDISSQTIASTADTLTVRLGETFVFVSGLGGRSVRVQQRSGPWWASIYTATQDATFGALFGHFNGNGIPGLAHFYFKNIRGEIIDEFWVRSGVNAVPVVVTIALAPTGAKNLE